MSGIFDALRNAEAVEEWPRERELSRGRRVWDAALQIFAVAAVVVAIVYCFTGD